MGHSWHLSVTRVIANALLTHILNNIRWIFTRVKWTCSDSTDIWLTLSNSLHRTFLMSQRQTRERERFYLSLRSASRDLGYQLRLLSTEASEGKKLVRFTQFSEIWMNRQRGYSAKAGQEPSSKQSNPPKFIVTARLLSTWNSNMTLKQFSTIGNY